MRRDPTFDEIKSAFVGHSRMEADRMEAVRNVLYSALRFHASNTAMSKKQAKSIAGIIFPWEKKDYGDKDTDQKVEAFIRGTEQAIREGTVDGKIVHNGN